MGKSATFTPTMRTLLRTSWTITLLHVTLTVSRDQKQLSLFSVVQFPNDDCTSSSSSTTTGTCYTSSECSSRSGSSDGSCAAGFGVCCVISTSTCGATVSSNNTYIRNPGYPSSYTPTSTGSCTVTVKKMSADICQLRLDFQSMSLADAAATGACSDYFEATGDTGQNPPRICGTNTGYHMYVEFGATSSDDVSLLTNYGDTSTKSWNILARQIACTASWKAPTDCVQYFTGISGNVQNYNFGNQLLQSQIYDNCIRQEKGYCQIEWQQNAATSPDTFQLDTAAGIALAPAADECPFSYVLIPDGSDNGVTALTPLSPFGFQTEWCGGVLGASGTTLASSITSAKQPFRLGVFTQGSDLGSSSSNNGFSLDYTQLPC